MEVVTGVHKSPVHLMAVRWPSFLSLTLLSQRSTATDMISSSLRTKLVSSNIGSHLNLFLFRQTSKDCGSTNQTLHSLSLKRSGFLEFLISFMTLLL